MAQRFFNKTTRVKYVKPYSNNAILKKESEELAKQTQEEIMIDNSKIEQVEELLNSMEGKNMPKQKIKIDKKDKGIIERTENSKIVLTEDNKMVLND